MSVHSSYHGWLQTSNQEQYVTHSKYKLIACKHYFNNSSLAALIAAERGFWKYGLYHIGGGGAGLEAFLNR